MKTISVTELSKLVQENSSLQLLDVRTPGEYGRVHVEQAVNRPLDSLKPARLYQDGCLVSGRPVYILCQSGGRARSAAAAFEKEGFDTAVVVEGGTAAWENAGLPVVLGPSRVISIERQVRIVAGLLVVAGIALSVWVHPWFLALPAFVGCGLVFAGITDWCGMGLLLGRMPWNR